jgi:hypothetical protein
MATACLSCGGFFFSTGLTVITPQMKYEFANNIRSRHSDIAESLDFIEQAIASCKFDGRFIDRIKAHGLTFENRLHWNLRVLANCTVLRNLSLLRGILLAVNDRNLPTALVVTRAHFETTGTLAYLSLELLKFRQGQVDSAKLRQIVRALAFGSRVDFEDDLPREQPINVLTQIEAVDKLGGQGVLETFGNYREGYNLLCEYSHPNSSALILGMKAEGPFDVSFGDPVEQVGLENSLLVQAARSERVFGNLCDLLEHYLVSRDAEA